MARLIKRLGPLGLAVLLFAALPPANLEAQTTTTICGKKYVAGGDDVPDEQREARSPEDDRQDWSEDPGGGRCAPVPDALLPCHCSRGHCLPSARTFGAGPAMTVSARPDLLSRRTEKNAHD